MIMANSNKRTGSSRSDIVFSIINTSFLIIIFLIVVLPLVYILSSSLSSTRAVMAGRVWLWPIEPTLMGYRSIFQYNFILSGYKNTLIYTTIGTAVNVTMTIMAAYPLSRKDLLTKNVIMFIFAFTMLFSGGMIPSYIVVNRLGLLNTRAVMILPGAISVWNVIITRTFFTNTISTELLEAAKLDGCNDIKFVLKVVLPLSGAIIAVMSLFYAVGHWNSFFNALIYLHDKKLYPLQMILREILILNDFSSSMTTIVNVDEMVARQGLQELLKYSLMVVSSLPVLCAYPFVQKFFVKGVMIGAIKG